MSYLNPERLVIVDESGAATNLVRTHARAPMGQRAVGTAPGGHYEQVTLVGALSLTGLRAMVTLPGAADTEAFVAFVEHVLVPELRPGQIVLLDNLRVHKAPAVQRLIEEAGCQVFFLPRYSPDFSPIEGMWSKIKGLLRRAGAHTTEALHAAIARSLDQITAGDAQGWFQRCGYAIP